MANQQNTKSVFDEFTNKNNKYSLSKTLRFELKPVGKTQQMLEDEDVFGKDRIRKEKYEQTKPYIDRLHRDFIVESLKGKTIEGLNEYLVALKNLQKNKNDANAKREFDKVSKKLRTQINNHFKTEKLFGKPGLIELKERYGQEEDSLLKNDEGEFELDKDGNKISIFDEWDGFLGYFDKFEATRKNFYKDDGTATAVVTRIIDQNLRRFCENIQLFTSVKNKIDFREVARNFSANLEDVFSLDYYNSCMLQDGIDTYNRILGGETKKETGEKLKGLNEIINKYRQDNKGEKIAFFKLLDKQILSEKDKAFFEVIGDDKELLGKLHEFYVSAEEKTTSLKALLHDFFHNQEKYELDKIYLSKEALNTILYKWVVDSGREEFQQNIFEQTKKEKIVKFDKTDDSYTFSDFIPLTSIKNTLDVKFDEEKIWKDVYFRSEGNRRQKNILGGTEPKWEQFLKIFEYEFLSLFDNEYQTIIDGNEEKIEKGYDVYKQKFEEIISKDESDFSVSSDDKLVIKNFVDNTLYIYQMGKYFALEKKRKWVGDEYETEPNFYENPILGFKEKFYDEAFEKIVKARMLLQSYLTKKPFNTEKWKLNFDQSTLLKGFTESKTDKSNAGTQYGAYILRKKNVSGHTYFLGISKNHHLLSFFDEVDNDKALSGYERLNYYQMMSRSIYGTSYNGDYQEDKASLTEAEVIQKLKDSLSGYVNRIPEIKEIITNSYKDVKGIQLAIDKLVKDKGHSFIYKPISNKQFVIAENSKNPFYLFEIKVKDFSYKSIGNKNLHTLYFESLVSEGEKNIDIGCGEIFHRPKSEELKSEVIVTKENKVTLVKNGERLVHHKRYLADRSFLHLSIVLNSREESVPKKEKGKKYFSYNFNQKVNNFLADNSGINVIGIDRGEKHLIYFAGIDQKGNLLKGKDGEPVLGSLNEINGKNYHQLLEERAKGRERARQDWQNIENIKDLKRGYISLAVRKLVDLIVEHNAILVLEDLNMRFKQIRGGIEKSVYQQLEKALIDKLNFLVNKGEKDPESAGHLLRAFQLTAPFTTFKDMGKQTGVIFYTQASYTSKTCPECGFRPNVKWDQDDLMSKIDISFSGGAFNIRYKMSDFIKQKNISKRSNKLYEDQKSKDEFVISTKDAIRYKWFSRNKKQSELNSGESKTKEQTEKGMTVKYDITECLKGLFEVNGIDYRQNISEQVAEKVSGKKFFKDLSYYLYMLSNTRSSVSGTNIDQINCACCGFCSDDAFRGVDFNGDANGAYNIARKGLMILDKINQYRKHNGTLDKMGWGDLFIDIEEWDKFTQSGDRDA